MGVNWEECWYFLRAGEAEEQAGIGVSFRVWSRIESHCKYRRKKVPHRTYVN